MLVIDAGGYLNNAGVGGILSFYAANIGVVGLVLDGAIRDVAAMKEGRWNRAFIDAVEARCSS